MRKVYLQLLFAGWRYTFLYPQKNSIDVSRWFICIILMIGLGCREEPMPLLNESPLPVYTLRQDTLIGLDPAIAVTSLATYGTHRLLLGDPGGRIYVMDGTSGAILDSIGRRGTGPGEFSGEPFDLEVFHDSLLLVIDARPRFRLHVWRLIPSIQFIRSIPLKNIASPADATWLNEQEIVLSMVPTPEEHPTVLVRVNAKDGALRPFSGFFLPRNLPESPFYRIFYVESRVPDELWVAGLFVNRLGVFRDSAFTWYALPDIPAYAPAEKKRFFPGYGQVDVPARRLFYRLAHNEQLYFLVTGEAIPAGSQLLVMDTTMTLRARIPLSERWEALAATDSSIYAVIEDTSTGYAYLARYTLQKID